MHRTSLVGMVSSSSMPRRREHPMAAQEHQKIFIGPDQGAHLPVLDIVHKVTAESSGGTLSILEWGLPPGQMIPPHTHTREDECNAVLKGQLTCDVGGEIVVAPVGSYVLTPGGFEAFFDEYEEIAAKLASGKISEDEHRRARAEISEGYGLIWHDERIPEARARFGIGS